MCELLAEGGRWTVWDLRWRLRWTGGGAEPALARLASLRLRGLVQCEMPDPTSELRYHLTPEGLTAVRRARCEAYGARGAA